MKLGSWEFKRVKKEKPLVVNKQSSGHLITDFNEIKQHFVNFNMDDTFIGKDVETALKYEVIDTGLRFICELLVQMEYKVQDGKGNFIEHDILESLQNPNTLQKRNDLLYQWGYYLQAAGRVYQTVKSKSNINPFEFELINLNPDNLFVKTPKKSILDITSEDLRVIYTEQLDHKTIKHELNKEALIRYSNGVSIDNINNYSPLDSLKNEIRNIEVAKLAKHNKLKLSGGIIGTPDTGSNPNEMQDKMLSPIHEIANSKTHKDLMESRLKHSGLSGNDHVKILTLAMKFQSLTKDLIGLDYDKEVLNDYRRAYRKLGISEHLTGLSEGGVTFENQMTALVNMYQSKIQNMADLNVSGYNERFFKGTEYKIVGSFDHLPIFSGVEKEKQQCNADEMRLWMDMLDKGLIDKKDFKKRFKI